MKLSASSKTPTYPVLDCTGILPAFCNPPEFNQVHVKRITFLRLLYCLLCNTVMHGDKVIVDISNPPGSLSNIEYTLSVNSLLTPANHNMERYNIQKIQHCTKCYHMTIIDLSITRN